MANIFNREGAERLTKRVVENEGERGQRLAGGLFHQMQELHSLDYFPDPTIEQLLLEQKEKEVSKLKEFRKLPDGLICFSPSGASKCKRELYYKAKKEKKDLIQRYPYQRRWTRNASAVHEATQRDLLYCEKLLDKPIFTVERMENGLPAWEDNIKTYKQFTYDCVDFLLYGMCDGILIYEPDGTRVGFEFKTKSTTLGAVGTFKLKAPADEHRTQCIAYSLLFGVDEFVIMYESLAKDGWMKGSEAKPDVRTFYITVTEKDRQTLLARFSEVADAFYHDEVPDREEDKCIFCPYQTVCKGEDPHEPTGE